MVDGDWLRQSLEALERGVDSDDFIELAEAVVDSLREREDALLAVGPILRLMEEHEDVDFGAPGPLVHFAESYFGRGYEDELVRSIERHATIHTVWMLNRVINGLEGEQRQRFVEELERVGRRLDLRSEVREFALNLVSAVKG